jgi:LacI family repressor for deo operon, udp, cdd, tsx, nupC, and nupG
LATISEVAAKANVSVATVSRVLNGSCKVSEERRRRVLQAVEELQYEPNLVGRMLRKSETRTLLVVFSIMLPDLIRGIKDAAAAAGYEVILQYSPGPDTDASQFAMLYRGMADGAILPEIQIDRTLLASLYDHFTIVQCGETTNDPQAHVVAVNNEEIACQMTRYLIEQGRKRIATVGIGDCQGNPAYFSRERREGARRALAEIGIPLDRQLHLDVQTGYRGGAEAADYFLSLPERPDAIFCFQDTVAVGCMQSLRRQGVAVPEDIAVAGFDDLEICRFIDPPLTSVKQPFYEIGREAVRTWMIIHHDQPKRSIGRQVRLAARLVLRESTGGSPVVVD